MSDLWWQYLFELTFFKHIYAPQSGLSWKTDICYRMPFLQYSPFTWSLKRNKVTTPTWSFLFFYLREDNFDFLNCKKNVALKFLIKLLHYLPKIILQGSSLMQLKQSSNEVLFNHDIYRPEDLRPGPFSIRHQVCTKPTENTNTLFFTTFVEKSKTWYSIWASIKSRPTNPFKKMKAIYLFFINLECLGINIIQNNIK